MSGQTRHTLRAALEGSPLGLLGARTAAELADGSITCSCPHPVTADRLVLPERLLCCHECYDDICTRQDPAGGACACCGAENAPGWTAWLSGTVLVLARVCEACGASANTAVCWN